MRTLTACLFAVVLAAESFAAAKPNLLWIVADDMGYADLGVQGSPDVRSPRIDSLARDGARFTQGYVSTPSCSPCRAGLLTGRYQQRFGYEFNPIRPQHGGAGQGLPLDQITIAQRLKTAGYSTGCIGKWHQGEEEQFHPQSRGFDEFFGFLWGGHDYFVSNDPEKGPVLRGRRPVELTGYMTDVFGDEACRFIEQHADKPFFLYLAFNAPHAPMQAPPETIARYAHVADERRRIYLAMVEHQDAAVGRVLDTLGKLKLDQNTLVFFLSDNGGATTKFSPNGASNFPLRGSKGDTWEGGIRVPMLLRAPGILKPGSVYTQPVISLDITATALAAAGVSSVATIDGVDLLPYLKGDKSEPPHPQLFWRYGKQMAIRSGDWKLLRPSRGPKEFEDIAVDPMLFNLAADIGEQHDLAAQHPEKVKELQSAWDQWNSGNMPPRWNETVNGKPVNLK